MNTKWQHYLQTLHSLDPLMRYTDLQERMQLLCPHLAPEEIEGILATYETTYFALPSVKVNGSFHIAFYQNDSSWAPHIGLYSPGSYADEYAYTTQAMAYANLHWPEHLIEDTWIDVQKVILANPASLNRHGRPRQIRSIHIGLRHSWLDLCKNGQPVVSEWDDAIDFATTSWIEGGEMTGRHPSTAVFTNCAHCGGGLGTSQCNGCGITYEPIPNGWDTPIAPKLVALLEHDGYRFPLSPSYLH